MLLTARAAFAASLLALIAACSGSSTSDALHACDPLASTAASPITLGTIVGAGRAADGTIYVLDRDPADTSNLRAFISQGHQLVRQIVGGTGEGGDFAEVTTGAESSSQIRVDLANGTAAGMSIGSGPPDPSTKGPGAASEQLALIDPSALAGYTVVNYAIAWQVDFDVASDDGKRMVVIAPTAADSITYRLFYGAPPTLTEYAVTDPGRGKDVCAPLDLDLQIGGQATTASFSVRGAASSLCPGDAVSTLMFGATTTNFHNTGTNAQGLAYMCR